MTIQHTCSFDKSARTCDYTCFACTFMHGLTEGKGMWTTLGVPKKYRDCRFTNLPIKTDNPKPYTLIEKYVGNILDFVLERNTGLFFYSVPTKENPMGTGTGKTTSAVTILNHFLIERCRAFLKGEMELQDNPALFVKSTELQNTFNAMFRGKTEMKETASIRYYNLKNSLKKCELVVFDDIATRGSRISEAFEEELYEILDSRNTNGLTTIFTSNVSLEEMSKNVGERITSRIAGMTVKVGFTGADNRIDALLK
ncbi:DNA replication protein [Bacillus sp. NPDC077027]|uniref:DNA replication protein n=1 Tax=Bacillus sp. NPDC077027 TaxID=3390548 RepID=UPI003D02BD57